MAELSAHQIVAVIDHTYLQSESEGADPLTQQHQVKKLVDEARQYGAYAVCVRPWMVRLARSLIDQTGAMTKVCSVVGFPNGDLLSPEQKRDEMEQAIADGADELDVVMRVGTIGGPNETSCYEELALLSEVAGQRVLKVICENAYLAEDRKADVWQKVFNALAQGGHLTHRFLKTSTGFAQPPRGVAIGATLDDIAGMFAVTQKRCGIKAAGGVKSLEDAREFLQAAGTPLNKVGQIDPMLFRIGSSSLLLHLTKNSSLASSDAY